MAPNSKLGRKKLGEILVDEGLLKVDQFQEALRRQRSTGETFTGALVAMGFLGEVDVARGIVKHLGLPYIDASKYRLEKECVQAVPAELMWQNEFVALDKIGKILVIAVSGILSGEVLDKIEQVSGSKVFVYVSTPAQVLAALEKHAPLNGKKAVETKPVVKK